MKRLLYLCWMLNVSLLAWAVIPPGYYDDADGLKKAELKAALHGLIVPQKVLSYGSGSGKTWTGFYSTDRYDGNKVRDRYSNDERTFKDGSTESAADAVTGMNIEHSFPKSWWGGTTSPKAYKDLFNLMPCEEKINSSKSNNAMGVVTTAKTNNGCTKVGTGMAGTKSTTLWEPADKWKGDFARNYFYMVTCYSELTWQGTQALEILQNDDWPTLQEWAYTLFLKWNKEDPVDEIEKERNEAVYGIQGNRNPFIDYPNLAEYIWGDSIAYAFHVDGLSVEEPGDSDSEEDLYEEVDVDAVLAQVDFTQGMEDWEIRNVQNGSGLSAVWTVDSQYGMKASAYVNGTKYKAESWLISPEMDLARMKEASLTFEHTGKYFGTMAEEASLWITTNDGSTWEQLTIQTYMTGKDWTYVENSTDLSAYKGNKVKVAFVYTSSTSYAPTWEIKNVAVSGVERRKVGDVDGNGSVSVDDAFELAEVLLKKRQSPAEEILDVSGEGNVSIADLVLLIDKLKRAKQ